MKANVAVAVWIHTFITSELDGVECLASSREALPPKCRILGGAEFFLTFFYILLTVHHVMIHGK
jgi:hypothetical protein